MYWVGRGKKKVVIVEKFERKEWEGYVVNTLYTWTVIFEKRAVASGNRKAWLVSVMIISMNLAVIKFTEGLHVLWIKSEAREDTQRSLVLKAKEACISVTPGNREMFQRLNGVRSTCISHLSLTWILKRNSEVSFQTSHSFLIHTSSIFSYLLPIIIKIESHADLFWCNFREQMYVHCMYAVPMEASRVISTATGVVDSCEQTWVLWTKHGFSDVECLSVYVLLLLVDE